MAAGSGLGSVELTTASPVASHERLSRREGQAEASTESSLGLKNRFSLEIDHMALCVRSGAEPRTLGEEGLQDQMIMAAIYESAKTGRPVALPPALRINAFRGPLAVDS